MRTQVSKSLQAVESVLSSLPRRACTLLVRPILRRIPRRLRGLLIRELSAGMPAADPDGPTMRGPRAERTVLPVLPSGPADDLHLACVKGFLVDRLSERQARDSRL
jgi:hypothetical protein